MSGRILIQPDGVQTAFDSGNLALARERLDQIPPELRRWEWHYLRRKYEGGVFTLYGHTGPVLSVAYSPDGKRLASASEDATAKVWDARTGWPLVQFRGHTKGVHNVAFGPDGTRLVTSNLCTVRLCEETLVTA